MTTTTEFKVGNIVIIKEPTQRFSHDVIEIKEIKDDEIIAIDRNDGETDGRVFDYPIDLWNKSRKEVVYESLDAMYTEEECP